MLLTPDPLSRRMLEDVEREPVLYQYVEKVATLGLPVIGCGPLEVPICEQGAYLPAGCPWHREVCCSPLLSLSLCLSKISHSPAGTAGVGTALALHGRSTRQLPEDHGPGVTPQTAQEVADAC